MNMSINNDIFTFENGITLYFYDNGLNVYFPYCNTDYHKSK